jgi:hypothetical protein
MHLQATSQLCTVRCNIESVKRHANGRPADAGTKTELQREYCIGQHRFPNSRPQSHRFWVAAGT